MRKGLIKMVNVIKKELAIEEELKRKIDFILKL